MLGYTTRFKSNLGPSGRISFMKRVCTIHKDGHLRHHVEFLVVADRIRPRACSGHPGLKTDVLDKGKRKVASKELQGKTDQGVILMDGKGHRKRATTTKSDDRGDPLFLTYFSFNHMRSHMKDHTRRAWKRWKIRNQTLIPQNPH